MSEFLVIAHRGASGSWPENTLLAFRKALDAGAKWLELDVHLSADQQLVVIHDATLQRTTNGRGRVSNFTLAELRALDAGQGEKIPLLSEVLDLSDGRARVNIELKGGGTAGPVAELLRQRYTQEQLAAEFLASSLNEKELRILSTTLPPLQLALVAESLYPQLWQLATELDVWSVNLDKTCIDQALVAKAKGLNRKLMAFTVNDGHQLQELKTWGVAGVFTDFPERFPQD